MSQSGRKRYILFRGVILIIIMSCLLCGARWVFFNIIHEDDLCDGIAELRERVTEDIESGKTSEVYYVSNISDSVLYDINSYIDTVCGVAEAYKVYINSSDYAVVRIDYKISENYYVIRKFKEGIDIPSSMSRALQIYQVMAEFYDSFITDDMTDYTKELTAHDYMVETCVYGYPADEADAYTAYGVLVEKRAVCDGYAECFAMLCECMGIDCNIVVGMAENEMHAWNQICLDGIWYNVDVTWDDALPDMGSCIRHSYFNVTDDVLATDHSWDKEYYYSCTETRYNYYKMINAWYSDYEEYKSNIINHTNSRNILEAVIVDFDDDEFDANFLYEYNGIRNVSYTITDFGAYTNIVIYTNR